MNTKFIAISGGSCSGKTTLADAVVNKLSGTASIVRFDDYYDKSKLPSGTDIDWESPNLYNFELLKEHLVQLAKGTTINVEGNSREARANGQKIVTVFPNEVILVEGFLALHNKELNELYNLKIFIDLPEQTIFQRRLLRVEAGSAWDDTEYLKTYLIPGYKNYVLPQKKAADYVINGELSTEKQLTEFLNYYSKIRKSA